MARRLEIEVLLLTMFAAVPLYGTQAVGITTLIVFHAAMLAITARVGTGRSSELIPIHLIRVLAVGYAFFYVADVLVLSRDTMRASTGLTLFIAIFQAVEAHRTRNHGQRLLVVALMFIASIATSHHILILPFVVTFGFLMNRQLILLGHIETTRLTGRDYIEVPTAKTAGLYLAGAVLIAVVVFPVLPRVRSPMIHHVAGQLARVTSGLSDTIDFRKNRGGDRDPTAVIRVWMHREAVPVLTPLRLRGHVYDRYVDGQWVQTPGELREIPQHRRIYPIARSSGVSGEAIIHQSLAQHGRLYLPAGTHAVAKVRNLFEGPAPDTYLSYGERNEPVVYEVAMARSTEPLRISGSDEPPGTSRIFPRNSAGVLAELEFDDDLKDSTANGRDAILLGGEFVSTRLGRGLRTRASRGAAGFDWSKHASHLSHPYTVEMVLTAATTRSYAKLFSFDDRDEDGWYYYKDGVAAYPKPVVGSGRVRSGERHYIAFVSISPSVVAVYLNGQFLGRTSASFVSPPRQAIFFSDDSLSHGTEQIDAVVEAVRISGVARTPSEIAAVQKNINQILAVSSPPERRSPARPRVVAYPVTARVTALARQIVGSETDAARRASLIEEHLLQNYSYLQRAEGGPMSVEEFLFHVRRGHCEYFAAAMVVLLASLDVPAQIVGGFYGGQLNPLTGFFVFRRDDAHAWVEVWNGRSWVTYDPTPPALRPGNQHSSLMRIYGSAIGEELSSFWDRYVLTFALSDQVALLSELRSKIRSMAMRTSSAGAAWLRDSGSDLSIAFVGGLSAMTLLMAMMWRRNRPLFDLMAAELRRLGVDVGPAMTIEEALERLRAAHPAAAVEFSRLIALYDSERFSGHPASERRQQIRAGLMRLRNRVPKAASAVAAPR